MYKRQSLDLLTFKEGRVFVGIYVYFLELADAHLFGKCELDHWLRVESEAVGSECVRLEFFLAKGDAKRDREDLACSLW